MHFGNGRVEATKRLTKPFVGKVYLDGIVKGRVTILKYMRGLTRFRYEIYQYLPAPHDRWQLMESGTELEQWYQTRKKEAENVQSRNPDTPE